MTVEQRNAMQTVLKAINDAAVHRIDEPTELSLSMVACPQCRFRFAGKIIVAPPRLARPTSGLRIVQD